MNRVCRTTKEFCDTVEYIAIRVAAMVALLYFIWRIIVDR